MTLLLVLLGGALGAAVRFVVHRSIPTSFPWATLAVNVAGSLVLGLISGLAAGAHGLPEWVRALAGTGFCGALTTYSTFSLETARLAGRGALRQASANAAATVLAGIGACWLGWAASN